MDSKYLMVISWGHFECCINSKSWHYLSVFSMSSLQEFNNLLAGKKENPTVLIFSLPVSNYDGGSRGVENKTWGGIDVSLCWWIGWENLSPPEIHAPLHLPGCRHCWHKLFPFYWIKSNLYPLKLLFVYWSNWLQWIFFYCSFNIWFTLFLQSKSNLIWMDIAIRENMGRRGRNQTIVYNWFFIIFVFSWRIIRDYSCLTSRMTT